MVTLIPSRAFAANPATPYISPAGGTYTSGKTVTISDATSGVTIYYTTDGSAPTTSSTVYSGSISIPNSPVTETIRAFAVLNGVYGSATSATYTIAPVLPAPTMSPAAGNYKAAQSVTLASSTSGSTIYYTTDGSTPTSSSAVYSGTPIAISSGRVTVAAMVSGVTGYTQSGTVSQTYAILPATPYISPAGGTFTTGKSVSISDSTSGSTIYYTTDGSTPTASSSVYSGPITVPTSPVTETITAFAIASGVSSSSTSATYTITPALPPPSISPAPGSYGSAQNVTLSTSTSGSTIYYTTDGSNPTTGSPVYNGTPITVTGRTTVSAIVAGVSGYTASSTVSQVYTIIPATPFISPAAGTYSTAQTVNISDSTAGTTIYYTTDGSAPTTSSTVYNGPISIPATAPTTETIRAFAVASGVYSAATSSTFTIAPTLPAPTFSPGQGSFMSPQYVTIASSTSGSTIYYTTDGSTPTTSSPVYNGTITVTGKTTISAMVSGVSGYTASSTVTQVYSIIPATPFISPAAGTYTSAQSVTISDSTSGTTIYYTTDGTAPTTSSAVYSGPISIPATPATVTVRAFAVASGVYSSAASTTYTITPTLPAPTFSSTGGNFTAPITVTISESTPGAIIYYTTDNSTPTTGSPQYTGGLTFSQNTSLKAMASATGYAASPVTHSVYAFLVPSPVITPTSGTYSTTQIITISDSLQGANIFYTLDGSTPTTSSPQYTVPFAFAPSQTGAETVQAMATSSGYQPSNISQSTITLALPSGVIATAVVGLGGNDTIAPNFLGLAHEWGAAQTMMGSMATGVNSIYQTLVNTLTTNMNGPLMVRIGGTSTDATGPATPTTVQPFVELDQAQNVDFILGVNLGSNNLSLAQEQAATFVSTLPSSALAAIEIGNEPDGYAGNGLRPSSYAYTDFLPQYQQWSQGVNSTTSQTVPIAGPVLGTGFWVPNAQSDVTGGALQASIYTQHKYVACYNASNPLPTNILLQPSSATGSLWLFQPFAAAVHQTGGLFRIAEMNSVCNGGQAGVSNTFSSALWAIDTMFEDVNAGIDGVNWNTNSNGGPYDLFQFSIWTKNGLNQYTLTAIRPIFYGLLFFSEAAGNNAQLLPGSVLTNSNITVYMTTDSLGHAHLVIINKEISTSGTVQITLPGYSTGSVVRLTASSYQATNGVTIGGQTYDGSTDGTLQGSATTETTTPTAGVWNIPVNAMSAVLVNLQP